MKITKLSLVAALAVASFSTANAQALAEAIKNVDVSGTVAYRYNDYENASSTSNNYKMATNIKSNVNDDLAFNTRVIAGDTTNSSPASFNTSSDADTNLDLSLSQLNFIYTGIANTAVTLGKQAINSPFTMAADSIGNEQTGTGLAVSTNVGPVSAYAAYFNQTNLENASELAGTFPGYNGSTGIYTGLDGADLYNIGVAVSLGGVNLDASYMDLDNKFDAYSVGLNASYKVKYMTLSSYARYSALDLDNSSDKNTLWKLGVNAKAGIFGASLGYGKTNKEGGTVGLDASSTTGFDEHWRVTLSTISDASALYAAASAQVTDKVNVALKLSDLNAGTDSNSTDQREIYTQVVYQMSSNFFTYVRFGQLEKPNTEDATIGRLHAQYSF